MSVLTWSIDGGDTYENAFYSNENVLIPFLYSHFDDGEEKKNVAEPHSFDLK